MKPFGLLLLVLFNSISLLAQKNNSLYESYNYKNAVEKETRDRDGKPGAKYWQNHADYKISVKLDTAKSKIYGTETITYYNESPDTLDRLVLRLYPNRYKAEAIRNIEINPGNVHSGVHIDTFVINEKTVTLNESTTQINGTNMAVLLENPLPSGEKLNLYCEWNYQVPTAPEFRREGYYQESAWFIGYFYPQIAVYDDMELFFGQKGWDYMLFHQGYQEFYNDFNNYSVTIEAPEDYFVWATGGLKNQDELFVDELLHKFKEAQKSDEVVQIITKEDFTKKLLKGNTWKYEAKNVTDFGFGIAKNYLWDGVSVKIGHKNVFVDAAYPSSFKLFDQTIDVAASTIKYSSEISPGIEFPYNYSTTFNGMLSGGMEFPMIANNSDIPSETFHKLVTYHEIFHNYFPFMMGLNEKRYPFLDEGLNEYFTNHYLENIHHINAYSNRGKVKNIAGIYNFYAQTTDAALINAYAQLNSSNTFYLYYIKPYFAYKFFSDIVGEKIFFEAIKEFVNRWKGKHPTPWDFFYTINDVLDKNYNWYWQEWFFELGYPDLSVETKDNKALIKKMGKGSLPLPVNLTITYNDETTKIISKNANIWEEGNTQYIIELENFKNIKKLELDTENVPDIDPSNNKLIL